MKDRVTDINHALLEASVEKGFAMNEFEVNRMPRPVALDRMLRAGMAIAEIKRVSKKDAVYAFTVLKKAKNARSIVSKLKSSFSLLEIEGDKDIILVKH